MHAYDVRAVRFIKSTSDCPVKVNQGADFICLGHFDMMHIDKLDSPTETPLLSIERDCKSVREKIFNCPENSIYSLYVFKEVAGVCTEEVAQFWQQLTEYTVVTRIHCAYPSDFEKEHIPFSDLLTGYCLAEDPSDPFSSNCVIQTTAPIGSPEAEQETVSILFYDSLELGDTVAILKSNSVTAILEVVRRLSQYTVIQDTYSYCGIRRELLQTEQWIPENTNVPQNAALSKISTRCSVRNIQNANLFLSKLNVSPEWQFYVTGTADLMIDWPDKTELSLLEIMWKLTQQSDHMHLCFNDIITRIGIRQMPSPHIPSTYSDSAVFPGLEQRYSIMQNTQQWLIGECSGNNRCGWKYTLLKLLRTLDSISGNYVMDDLAELIVPSVCAFLARIEYLRAHTQDKNLYRFEDDIVNFLYRWTELINNIQQLESQLTQHPELMPIRYYIPATLLRFEAVFFRECCKAFRSPQTGNYVPMLIPADVRYLSTKCILDPKQENYKGDSPLLILIPFTDLYHPWNVAIRIAHEMAHYCENDARNRNLRYTILRNCAAIYIVKCWYQIYFPNKDKDTFGLFYQNTIRYADIVDKKLEKHIAALIPDASKITQWYLHDTQLAIRSAAPRFMRDFHEKERYLFYMEQSYFFQNEEAMCNLLGQEHRTQMLTDQEELLDQHINALAYLCSECFADIAMIVLLNCSFHDYYKSVFEEEFGNFQALALPPEILHSEPEIMRQFVRMALVIHAVQSIRGQDDAFWGYDAIEQTLNQKGNNSFFQYVLPVSKGDYDLYGRLLNSGLDNPAAFAGVEDITLLQNYVRTCAQDLATNLAAQNANTDTLSSLSQALSYLANDAFSWKDIYNYIDHSTT